MSFVPFELEHYQSLHERNVEINLADSSVKCVGIREWLNEAEQQSLLDTTLFYPEVNGTRLLRERIAGLHSGATAENVLVTVGASQANAMVCETLLEPGDEVVVMSPGYRQVWGTALNRGCVVRDFPLDERRGWRPDLDRLADIVSPRTRLVSINNPNNPTGTILTQAEGARIVEICASVGAWLHVDEVYAGTEHAGDSVTPSFWGSYARCICVNSLSKAYGLAGLRVGWVIAGEEMIEALWRRHEYAVIAAAAPSMRLAELALLPEKRAHLIQRQRGISRAGREVMMQWLDETDGVFSVQDAQATSIAFVKFNLPSGSRELAEHIRKTQSVLVAPGAYLGAEGHLRITVGYEPEKIAEALRRVKIAVSKL